MAEAKSRRAFSAFPGSSWVRKRRKMFVSTKTLRIRFGSHATPRCRDLAANAAEVLRPVFRLHRALEIEDGPVDGLQDNLLSTQMEGDPVSQVQPQSIPQGLGYGDLTFTSESRVGHG